MTSLLEQRKLATIERKQQSTALVPVASDPGDIVIGLQRALKSAEVNELETSPRNTVLKMLMTKKMDEYYIFKTTLGQGANYVQAMRQVLTRTRRKAKLQKQTLDEFKLFEISIVSEADHDVVTLERSKRLTKEEGSVYDDLINACVVNTPNLLEHREAEKE
jgi:hypothetical protein